MEFYNESDLSKLSILQFSKQLTGDKSINYLNQLVENDERFIFYNADVFRQGVCQVFAYALHKRFGYKVYIISIERGCHIFCKTLDNQYVDVRGMTHSFDEFISGLALPNIKNDTSEAYSFTNDDLNGAHYDIALAFANALIDYDIQRYKI
ncbi:MAG: hypothetical protein IJB37_07005 [Peptococcaceae bacterium]|nr:hypothetical protein [Peptococcaceae bacterium]